MGGAAPPTARELQQPAAVVVGSCATSSSPWSVRVAAATTGVARLTVDDSPAQQSGLLGES